MAVPFKNMHVSSPSRYSKINEEKPEPRGILERIYLYAVPSVKIAIAVILPVVLVINTINMVQESNALRKTETVEKQKNNHLYSAKVQKEINKLSGIVEVKPKTQREDRLYTKTYHINGMSIDVYSSPWREMPKKMQDYFQKSADDLGLKTNQYQQLRHSFILKGVNPLNESSVKQAEASVKEATYVHMKVMDGVSQKFGVNMDGAWSYTKCAIARPLSDVSRTNVCENVF